MWARILFKKWTKGIDSSFPNGGIWTLLLFSVISIVCLYKGFRFQYPNFIFTYPFISYDGYQWMSDGLHYLDRNIEATHRNPALPLIFALLRSLGLVDSFPVAIALLTISFYVSAYFLIRAFFDRDISRLTVLWFFFVFRIHSFFDYILSDPWCLVLIIAGLGCLLRAVSRPKMLIGSAAAFGLAMNFQFTPAFASPALLWFLLYGIGIKNLKQNKAISTWSVVLFLVLALPQFIYKWIAFGSPLYSHVIHFPLIRAHLYGLPYYAVNFFAFLGWPLALTVLWGFYKSFNKRESDWQLIHLYSFCMFIFWIICYLWLDVRFLLYLIPGWLIYSAKGVQALNVLNWLRFPGKTAIQRCAIAIMLYFAVSLAAFRAIGFESTILPVTPQTSIRFSSSPISEWKVGVLTADKISIEYSDSFDTLFNLPSYFHFYRDFALRPRDPSLGFRNDVLTMAIHLQRVTSSKDRIGLCGDLGSVFETKMKIHFAIARNVGGCDASNKLWIANSKAVEGILQTNPDYEAKWRGGELTLLGVKL